MNEKQVPQWGDFVKRNGRLVKYFPIHKAQQDILTSPAQYRLFLGGVGSGKTSSGAIDLRNHVEANPKGTYLVVAPSNKILDSATIPTWQKVVAGTHFEGVYKRQRSLIELPTGGVIYVRSCYDSKGSYTGSFEGIQADYAWIDEAGQIPRTAWQAVLRRTSTKAGRIFLSTTPYSFNWLKRDFFDRAEAGDKKFKVVKCRSIDNPGFSKDTYQHAKETAREHEFKMFYEAEWAKASGLVYPDFPDCIVDTLPKGLAGEWVGGIDFGYNDKFCALAGVVDQDLTLWLCYERYLSGKDILEHGEALEKLPVPIRWYCDSANPDNIRVLRRNFGLSAKAVKKGPGSVAFGVNLLTHVIKTGKLKVVRDSCPNLIIESESYAYDENEGELTDKIRDGQRDHALDSCRYVAMGIYRKLKMN